MSIGYVHRIKYEKSEADLRWAIMAHIFFQNFFLWLSMSSSDLGCWAIIWFNLWLKTHRCILYMQKLTTFVALLFRQTANS
jgi:hypothetical protein